MKKLSLKILNVLVITAFLSLSFNLPSSRGFEIPAPGLPRPGSMVSLSDTFTPAHLQGLTIHTDNPFEFDFLVNKGGEELNGDLKIAEYKQLIKYFLASLTVPDEDQWVNLSPYEKSRIVSDDLGKTEMGRRLLAQDYLLKQLTSSLMYPESGLGKEFWGKVYERAYKQYGTTDIPVNTFNKVWIVPDQAVVYESGNSVYVLKSHLKVMLEEDYLSLAKHNGIRTASVPAQDNRTHAVASKVIRQMLLPVIEKEVNEGRNFAQLRQVVSGMVLATWYKKALRESLLSRIYADKAKVNGVDQDPKNNELIYREYLSAFKKGVYNYIKEDEDLYTRQPVARKYFAGGFWRNTIDGAMVVLNARNMATRGRSVDFAELTRAAEEHQLDKVRTDLAMLTWRKAAAVAGVGIGLVGGVAALYSNDAIKAKAVDFVANTFNLHSAEEQRAEDARVAATLLKYEALCSTLYGDVPNNYTLLAPAELLDETAELNIVLHNLNLPNVDQLKPKLRKGETILDRINSVINNSLTLFSLPNIQDYLQRTDVSLASPPDFHPTNLVQSDEGLRELKYRLSTDAKNFFVAIVTAYLNGHKPIEGVDNEQTRDLTWDLAKENLPQINEAIKNKTGIANAFEFVPVDPRHWEMVMRKKNVSARIMHWNASADANRPHIYYNGMVGYENIPLDKDNPEFDQMWVFGTDQGFKFTVLKSSRTGRIRITVEPDNSYTKWFHRFDPLVMVEKVLKAQPLMPAHVLEEIKHYFNLNNAYAAKVVQLPNPENPAHPTLALLVAQIPNELPNRQESIKPQIFNAYTIRDLQRNPGEILYTARELTLLNRQSTKFDYNFQFLSGLNAKNLMSRADDVLNALNTASTLYLWTWMKEHTKAEIEQLIGNTEVYKILQDRDAELKKEGKSFLQQSQDSLIDWLTTTPKGEELNRRVMFMQHFGTWKYWAGTLESTFVFKAYPFESYNQTMEMGQGRIIPNESLSQQDHTDIDEQLMELQYSTPEAYRALTQHEVQSQYNTSTTVHFASLPKPDGAQTAVVNGGIDLNSRNLHLIDIKRDGLGVPLPFAQQDIGQLNRITGFEPQIKEILPVTGPLPVLSELKDAIKDRLAMSAPSLAAKAG